MLGRLVLTDAAWKRMAPLIMRRPDQKRSTGRHIRMFVEGMLGIVRTGSPWRDLPDVFGDWNSVFRRLSRWGEKDVWRRIFEAMSNDPDFEYLTGGQCGDCPRAYGLIEGLSADVVMADAAYDADPPIQARNRASSRTGSPRNARRFCRDVSPATMAISPRRIARASAKKRISASLAAPSTGGAATRNCSTALPSAPTRSPSRPLRCARGVSRTQS